METGVYNKNVNFYDPTMRMDYGVSYDMDGLELAANIHDCRNLIQDPTLSSENLDVYKGCGHAILELWSGQDDVIAEMLEKEALEPPSFLGVIGQEGWLIPKYTADADSTLLSYFGMAGEENRKKLADRFLRPTTWGDYCIEVSPDNCGTTSPVTSTAGTNSSLTNGTVALEEQEAVLQPSAAVRPPENEHEAQKYFVDGLFTGHFRKTEENDCEKWPKNCTGHFLDYPCGWTSFFIQQRHHLNIALESNGNEPGANGYSYGRAVEIWHAANYTKSDIIGWWWRPEALYQQYQGTDFELQNVVLPPTNHRCADNRVNIDDRCGTDDMLRVGNPEGVCDVPPIPNYKLISTGLYKLVNDPEISVPMRSPAYDVVNEYSIDGFQLGEIFEYWLTPNFDKFGFDPRDAVCKW